MRFPIVDAGNKTKRSAWEMFDHFFPPSVVSSKLIEFRCSQLAANMDNSLHVRHINHRAEPLCNLFVIEFLSRYASAVAPMVTLAIFTTETGIFLSFRGDRQKIAFCFKLEERERKTINSWPESLRNFYRFCESYVLHLQYDDGRELLTVYMQLANSKQK